MANYFGDDFIRIIGVEWCPDCSTSGRTAAYHEPYVGTPIEGEPVPNYGMIDAWAVIGAEREVLDPPAHWRWPKPSPFVHGWKVGNMLFLGGQRALDRDGRLLGLGDIEIQTDEAFRNLDTMLKAGGGDRHNLMRQNTYFRFFGEGRAVTDYWEKMTAVRRRYMSVPSAAGAGLRIESLSLADELIQVEGIGVLGDEKQRLQPAGHWDWSIPGNQFTQGWKIGRLAFIGGQISADARARAVGHEDGPAREILQKPRTAELGSFLSAVLH